MEERSTSVECPLWNCAVICMDKQTIISVEGYRLSPQQERLWSLHQQQEGSHQPYLTQGMVPVEGSLDMVMLQSAIQRVIDRYEILRTSFHCIAGMMTPVQVIADQVQANIHYQDLSGMDAQEQQAVIECFSCQQRESHFDLEQTSPLRLALFKLALDRHLLLMTLPALCADMVGLENILKEIHQAYRDCGQEEKSCDDVLQYADLAEWQHELLESEDAEHGRAYWRQQLSALHESPLPYEGKPAYSTFAPQSFALTLDAETATKARAFVQNYGGSFSPLFLSCWHILLWRICGDESVVVGTCCDGRSYEGLKEAPGLFARYLPIPAILQEKRSFSDVVQQIEQTVHEGVEWQEYFDWGRLVEPGVEQPRFIPFCYEFRRQAFPPDDVHFSFAKLSTCIDRFKIKLSITERDDALLLDFSYDSQLFAQEAIERLAAQFCTVLHSALDQPEKVIGALEFVGESERRQVLALNNTQVAFSGEACIHELFAAQAARTPAAIAVVCDDQTMPFSCVSESARHLTQFPHPDEFGRSSSGELELDANERRSQLNSNSMTYQELQRRSNQVARYLQSLGVGPEVPVGICLERSLDVMVGIFGILKAGGAYVPLDPSSPPERLAYMLSNARATLLLTQEELRTRLALPDVSVVCLDSDWQIIAGESDDDLPVAAGLDNLAYIIYTSGSTGRPKGVMIEHRSLTNYIHWVVDHLLAETTYHLPAITRLSFDASLKQIFAPLLCGGTVQLLADDVVANPIELLRILSASEKIGLNCVPTLWDALLDCMQSNPMVLRSDSITDLFVGGEALKPDLVAKSLRALPHLRIHNLYGPTEATANASYQRVTSQDAISIGLPIANTQIHLLDASLHMLPIGVPGEIYIGGRGVARGYRENPALTAERFVPDPFSSEPGARLYRTGDLALRKPTGEIEYLGRLDKQVKIRGFRIEPGEIEMLLCQQPGVRAAVVTAREEKSGQQALVAYIVAEEQHPLFVQRLAACLKAQVPEYMVPSSFIVLETLPLMPNGKIDYQALSSLRQVPRYDPVEEYVAPQTPVEKTLATIWSEALAVERVGIHDDFFALGGNSLLIMKITTRIREAFHIDLPLRTLLEANTVSELSSIVSRAVA